MAKFSNGTLVFDATEPSMDSSGKYPLACWTSSGALIISDILGTPSNPSNMPISWFEGTGPVIFERMRFGGESGAVAVRIRKSLEHNRRGDYSRDVYGLPWEKGGRASITINDSWVASCANRNWLEIYEEFPTMITLRNTFQTSPAYGYEAVVGSYGVWVDSGVSLPEVDKFNKTSCLIHIDGFGGRQYSFRQSSDPKSPFGIDITSHIRQFFDSEGTTRIRIGTKRDISQNNLFPSGVYDFSSFGGDGIGLAITGKESSTGYPLTVYEAQRDDAYFQMTLNAPWGTGLAPGEYVFSAYARATWTGAIGLGMEVQGTNFYRRVVRLVGDGIYQRIWYAFYHDGISKKFVVLLYGIPKEAIFSLGLFAIHKGIEPAPYTFPVDNPASPTTNVTAHPGVHAIYYGTGEPILGTYKQGDIIYNTNPQPGSYIGWICTSGGTRGTWKGFGAISL